MVSFERLGILIVSGWVFYIVSWGFHQFFVVSSILGLLTTILFDFNHQLRWIFYLALGLLIFDFSLLYLIFILVRSFIYIRVPLFIDLLFLYLIFILVESLTTTLFDFNHQFCWILYFALGFLYFWFFVNIYSC